MGITAAVIGAAGAVGSAYISSQAAGGGGGAGSYPNLNAASEFANSLLGQRTKKQAKAEASGIFSNLRGQLYNYMNDPELGVARALASRTTGNFNDVDAYFRDSWLPGIDEIARTGLPTDLEPIIAKRKADFWRDLVPQMRENFIGQTGTYSTDFLNALGREGSRLETDLGALEVELAESAANRRAAAYPQAANMGISFAGLPAATALDYLSVMDKSHPGSRALDVLGTVGGIASGGQYIQQGYNPYGSQTGQLLSAAGSGLGSVFLNMNRSGEVGRAGGASRAGILGVDDNLLSNQQAYNNLWGAR